MKKVNSYILLVVVILLSSCSPRENKEDNANVIRLKWFSSHTNDSFENQLVALKWCMLYLGSNTVALDNEKPFSYSTPYITMNIDKLGFNENALKQLKKLHTVFKNSEEYRKHGAFDLGKYIVMTLGSSHHYYKIHDTSKDISAFTTMYLFHDLKGYINNSSISRSGISRIVSYSTLTDGYKQAYVSKEVNETSQEAKEFEAFERMQNGQLKFAVYNVNGNLIPNSNRDVSGAGKPAKCIWCHEVVIQPLFRPQGNFNGYLSASQLSDTLDYYGSQLKTYQDSLWKDNSIKRRALHTNMELSYISYMEPSAQRLSIEWGIPLKEVHKKLQKLATHRHHEFDFLGDLYHRKDVDVFGPYRVIRPPGSVREESEYEPNLLDSL